MNWQSAINELHSRRIAYCIVTLIGVEGSAPRSSGTKMIVDANTFHGSIGGGNLEFTCTQKARELLLHKQNTQVVEYYPLSAKFNQCCSGAVSVLFESFVSYRPQVAIFGAGHVAKELSIVLPRLDYSLTIVDQREKQFDEFDEHRASLIFSRDPLTELAKLSAQTYVLIMTHDHQLDFELCLAGLKEHDFEFFGLIGSKAKAKKFKTRLAEAGLCESKINHLTSPIGFDSIPGKHPMEVAVSVSAQLIALESQRYQNDEHHQGIDLKETLKIKEKIAKQD